MRQIALDTETTGLSAEHGHRLTEIGCVEIIDRKVTGNIFQTYINPERDIEAAVTKITGLTREFLADKPKFAEVAEDFISFIQGAELIIHNAPFDISFINHELQRMQHSWQQIENDMVIIDTLVLARKMHPGQRNNLDALCRRYKVDNSHREKHGALVDAKILTEVYFAMTAGQINLMLTEHAKDHIGHNGQLRNEFAFAKKQLKVIKADAAELSAHAEYLQHIKVSSGGDCQWEQEDN